jgi:hypothetical protein
MTKPWWKPREERRGVLLPARMRDADGWHDVTICNVSSRGLMIKASPPPARGSFIELRKNDVCIVGQVKWSRGTSFGVRAQDRVDIHYLCTSEKSAAPASTENDRRSASRSPDRPLDLVQVAERNRFFGRIFDYAVIVTAVITAGIVLSQMAGSALKAPLAKASAAMAGQQSHGD